jgi:hypothetical protein
MLLPVRLFKSCKTLISGNLTKHMKSKAHMKKCLELGVSVTSVEDPDAEEAGMNQTD